VKDGQRRILHVDMDAFYASVEQRDEPTLRGKALVVGGGTNRGVVAAASYEARVFGIHSAMPIREARQRCPHLLQVRPRMAHYQAVSRQVFAVFRDFTPLVEGLSLDEAFLDVSASVRLFGDEVAIARRIKARIREETELNASVGVAPNKLVAKIASDLDKPNGLVVVTADNLRTTLDPLSAGVIPGIGRVTQAKMRQAGIRTIRELRCAPDAVLDRLFGRYAARMRERASGIDDRPVVAVRRDKSISAEETFDSDLNERTALHAKLLQLAEKATARMRGKALVAGTVQVKIRRADFKTFTRQRAMTPPTNQVDQFYRTACELLSAWQAEQPGQRIRLLGVGGSDFSRESQQDLFAAVEEKPRSRLDHTVDQVRDRFGSAALGRARTLKPD